jgi:outer membrane biosynthesis protein TonB
LLHNGGKTRLHKKITANLIITLLLIGAVAGISSYAFTSSLTNVNPVYGQVNVPIPGASVSATGDAGSGSATANAQGQYSITSFLDTGTYSATASAPGYIDQQVNNIHVTAGAQTSNVNIIMNVSAGISGKVTDAATGLPVSFVIITVESLDGAINENAFTDSNGNYQITQNLQTGTYNVTAQSFLGTTGFLSQTKSGIALTAGSMTNNQNFALAYSAVITGTITDSITHAPLNGTLVEVQSVNGVYSGFAAADSNGKYTINSNLGTGTYNVTEFSPTGHLTNTVSGQLVTTGQTTTVNIALSPSGVISGKVTNSVSGQPLSGVDIFVTNSIGSIFYGSATTDSSGNYQVNTGLTTGTYTVEAFYGSSFATYPSGVNVIAGQTTSSINFQLNVIVIPSGTVSGKVTSSGVAIDSAYVTVQGPGGSNSNYTDSNGNYIISSGLGTGSYTVNVTATGFVSQQQTAVSVTVNQVTTINFGLSAKASGIISGQVLASQANPFPTPTPSPTATPTPSPSSSPTPVPTASPTPKPTATPTPIPTASPSPIPTASPTPVPTASPTPIPTASPTPVPTATATPIPTAVPTSVPTAIPTPIPTTSTSTPKPTVTPTSTPSPTPAPTTVQATTSSGSTVNLAIKGSITSSQMSDIKIATDKSTSSTTLSFTVTGTSGTTGFGNITMPKSAIAYGTTPTVNIDGLKASNQGYTQDSNNYYVWYTTTFSTHQVSITFTTASSATPTPTTGPSTPQGYIYGIVVGVVIVVIVAIIGVVLLLRRRNMQKS